MLKKLFESCALGEGWLAGEQKVERTSQSVEIGTGIDGTGVLALFGRHIIGRADHRSSLSQGRVIRLGISLGNARQPHVEDFENAAASRFSRGGAGVCRHQKI